MDTNELTAKQFETLVLIRSMEEFITDKHENLSKLDEVIWTFEESLSIKEHKELVENLCSLIEKGYLLSYDTDGCIELDQIPDVENITPKGRKALEKWEQKIRKEATAGNKIVIFEDCSLFSVNLIDISNTEILKSVGGVFKSIADTIKGKL